MSASLLRALPRSIVCTVSDPRIVAQIVRDLRASGFSSDDIAVLSPDDDPSRLEVLEDVGAPVFAVDRASASSPLDAASTRRLPARDPVLDGLALALSGIELVTPSIDVLRAKLDAGSFVVCVRVVDSVEVRVARSALDENACPEIASNHAFLRARAAG